MRNNILSKISILLSFILISNLISCDTKIPETSVEVDISKTGEPIEKYIYGQFIEHLGRCIYGGLWAEMLEDRKFYFPIVQNYSPWATDSDDYWNAGEYSYLKASPWEMLGHETVKMDTIQPYTGKQSAIIQSPGGRSKAGIRQAHLEVVANKKYTGHIILSGSNNTLPVTIQLISTDGDSISQELNIISNDFLSYSFDLTPNFSSSEVALEIFSTGKGEFRIGTVSIMPTDNIKGWRRDVLGLLKELNSPVYRWPGGNFVSGYNWMDGIGDRDKRPTRKNPAWKGVEANDVGIHEYMELIKIIDAEPFIAVNTGLGTVEEIASEIEYCNGSTDTKMGKMRAENGHAEPYKVKWWAVGNEMYGSWQLGHMPLEEYVQKHNRIAEAIWDVDPEAKLIAVGAVGEWSKTMLKLCAENMDILSEHIYCQELDNVSDHISQLAKSINRVAEAHRTYRDSIPGLKGRNIRIAMDEWNYWYGDYIYGELGVRYHQKDALGVAKGLHAYFRNSDIFFMANYAQTVNVIGCIKTTPTSAGFATTGLPLKLYRQNFGTIPVLIENNHPNLDISIALTSDKKELTIAVINSSSSSENLLFDLGKIKTSKTGTQWLIHHLDPDIYNEPGKTPNVNIIETDMNFKKKAMIIPGLSILMIKVDIY